MNYCRSLDTGWDFESFERYARDRASHHFRASFFHRREFRTWEITRREEKKKETETETETETEEEKERKKREHPMGSCTIAFAVVASRELSRQYILGRLRKDMAEVGDIRPYTASVRGFTMKFDWHLTLVRFIMAGVLYYQIIESSNIIGSARQFICMTSRNLLRKTNTRTMDDKTMRRNGSHDSWGFFFRWIEQYLFSWLRRIVSEHSIDGLKIFSGSITGLARRKNICINKFWDTEVRENTDAWLIWICTTLRWNVMN